MFKTSLSMLRSPATSFFTKTRHLSSLPRVSSLLPSSSSSSSSPFFLSSSSFPSPSSFLPRQQTQVRTLYDARTEHEQLVKKYKEAGGCSKCLEEGSYECHHEEKTAKDYHLLEKVRTSILDNRERIFSKDRQRAELNIPYNVPGKISLADWESFFVSRGIPGAKDPKYQRFLSKALTFPLTLAQFFEDRIDYPLTDLGVNSFDEMKSVLKADEKNYLRVCLVGVRAELTFPAAFWRELGLIFPNYHFSLIMVGPEAPLVLDNQMVQAGENVSLTCYRRFYHDIHEELVASNYVPDLFVGLNTGIGFQGYNGSWDSTLRDILSTKKPFILTSHDLKDQERDVTFLKEHTKDNIDWLLHPTPNKFKSLFHDVLAQDISYIINTNWSVFAIQGK